MEEFGLTTTKNHMSEELIYLIIKRLSNTITSEEVVLLEKWLEKTPENRRIFNEVSDIWLASARNSENNFDSSVALEKVRLRLEAANNNKNNLLLFQSLKRIAAIVILVISLTFIGYYAGVRNRSEPTSEITQIEAPLGSRTKINLPDGTKVWLNGGSTLRFGNSFNKTDREVAITGEGYFDVTPGKQIPFVVNTREIRIKVLGTAFNIRAYPEDGAVETTLERGSLSIETLNRKGEPVPQTILEPNQRATYIKHEGVVHLSEVDKIANEKEIINVADREPVKEKMLISKKIDTQVFTSWKDNKLVFRNEPFESLTIKLERWYGVHINIVDEEIKKYHFNGTFEKETIHDVLNIIHYTLPIKYTVSHDQVSISIDKKAWKTLKK
jgi:ferric-dicitrate binding protein FerR (iron transport regulator)